MKSNNEIQKIIEQLDQERTKRDAFLKEMITVKLSIAIEGMVGDIDSFSLGSDIAIKRIFRDKGENKRTSFLTDFTGEYFVDIEFQIERGRLNHTLVADKLILVSNFFAFLSEGSLILNKTQQFVLNEGKWESIGFIKTNNWILDYSIGKHYKQQDLEHFKNLWPVFKERYQSNYKFQLIVNRTYYSFGRANWQDKLVDVIIALEAFFTSEYANNIANNIANRLSILIWDTFDRNTVVKTTKCAYELRNKIVHGEAVLEEELRYLGKSLIKSLISYLKVAIEQYLICYSDKDFTAFIDDLDLRRKSVRGNIK